MGKTEIIRKFLEKGYQLDSASLNFFEQNPQEVGYFLSRAKEIFPTTTITFDLIKKAREEVKLRVQILKQFEEKQGIASIEDFVVFYSRRYNEIKKILVNHLDLVNLVSINKISQKTKRFSLIVVVREKREEEKAILVEDLTGEILVFLDEKILDFFPFIIPGDILGLFCEREKEAIIAKKLIFPDIPLKRQINKTKEDIFCLFVSDLHMESKDFNKKSYENFLEWIKRVEQEKLYIFVLGDVSSSKEDVLSFFKDLPEKSFKIYLKGSIDPEVSLDCLIVNDPCFLRIEDVIFLITHSKSIQKYHELWASPPETILLNLLKRRNLDPALRKRVFVKDPFIIDIIPDIFVSGYFHSPSSLNYKGTTILTTGSFLSQPIFWLVNLRTREFIKLDFT